MLGRLLLLFLMPMAADSPAATIQKKCATTYKKNSKNICFCVTQNLSQRLNHQQLQSLAQIYKDKHGRRTASQNPVKKSLVGLDYEVHRQCALDPAWKMPKEDLGEPDPLN